MLACYLLHGYEQDLGCSPCRCPDLLTSEPWRADFGAYQARLKERISIVLMFRQVNFLVLGGPIDPLVFLPAAFVKAFGLPSSEIVSRAGCRPDQGGDMACLESDWNRYVASATARSNGGRMRSYVNGRAFLVGRP